MDEDVQKELDELEAIALRIVRRDAANERDRATIRDKLPGLRAKGVKAADLERKIHSVYVAGTISRWTKDVAPPRRKKTAREVWWPQDTPEPPEVTSTPDGG